LKSINTSPARGGLRVPAFAGRAGTRTALHAERVRVELAAGRARDEKFFVRVNEC